MSRLVLDAELREKLGDLSKVIDVCNESGRRIARIVPDEASSFEPPFSRQELDRIHATTTWHSSDEVFARLRKLENNSHSAD